MPAAAVIPAPIANTNFVAVKTLVVGKFSNNCGVYFDGVLNCMLLNVIDCNYCKNREILASKNC